MSAIAERPSSTNRASEKSSHGSTMSTRWCRTSACSSGDGLAVPMSMPRYTCMASAETSSTSPSRRAISRASADFPDAVGPRIASHAATWRSLSGGDRNARAVLRPRRDLDQLAGEVMGRGSDDANGGERAGGQPIDTAEVHELVLARSPGEDLDVLATRA